MYVGRELRMLGTDREVPIDGRELRTEPPEEPELRPELTEPELLLELEERPPRWAKVSGTTRRRTATAARPRSSGELCMGTPVGRGQLHRELHSARGCNYNAQPIRPGRIRRRQAKRWCRIVPRAREGLSGRLAERRSLGRTLRGEGASGVVRALGRRHPIRASQGTDKRSLIEDTGNCLG